MNDVIAWPARLKPRLQTDCGVLQTPTDDDNDDRRQRAKQYWLIRRASKNDHPNKR